MSFSRSLKQPKLDIAWRTSVSKSFADGIMWVCMTSIIDIPKCTSPLPPAITHECLFISFNWNLYTVFDFYKTNIYETILKTIIIITLYLKSIIFEHNLQEY